MKEPLVSIICLSYNHEKFLEEAIQSVMDQTYTNIEVVVVDDASLDSSQELIKNLCAKFPTIQPLFIARNVGNCKAFNLGFALSKGEYVIDFATDDVMLPERIAKQVNQFQSLSEDVGVVFSDAVYINEQGVFLRQHYEYLFRKRLLSEIPEGDIYAMVLSKYFIASPTMMARRTVFEKLGGYDENLAYEDFDFWIRSSRNYKYAFLNEKLTKIRRKHKSLSSGWYKPGDKQLHSTYVVCKKAQELNRSKEDTLALVKRCRYELRQSFFSENVTEAKLFFQLLVDLQHAHWLDYVIVNLSKLHLPMSYLRMWYHRLRYDD